MFKSIGALIICCAIVCLAVMTYKTIYCDYEFEKIYSSSWDLSDRASTIKAKKEYLTIFLDNLKKNRSDFAEYNAVFLYTDACSFDKNLNALQTLVDRLSEIQNMSTDSFQYNTAIQQITAQEQGEATNMMKIFYGCYKLKHYPMIWNWIGCSVLITNIGIICVGFGIFLYGIDNDWYRQ